MRYHDVERVEGNLVYIVGAPFPFKGAPTPETIQGIDILKKILKGNVWALKSGVEYVLEHDWAYRLRYLDLCTAADREQLVKNPRKEIKRLLALNEQRDYLEAHTKIRKFAHLFSLLLYIPTIRREFTRKIPTLPVFDDADLYWALQRNDYNVYGWTYTERMQFMKDKGWTMPQEKRGAGPARTL